MSENNKALLRRFYDAWNEQKMDEVASMIAPNFIDHATHIGTYRSIPPTGKRFAMETISIMRLENEQFVEHWECSDFPGVMKQLGATIILENGTHA